MPSTVVPKTYSMTVDKGMFSAVKKKPTDTESLGLGATTDESTGPVTSDMNALTQALQRQYENSQYTARTDEERQQQAENQYSSYYNQLRQAAEQSAAQNDLALQQQREGLQGSYDQQRLEQQRQYYQSYGQADRQLLSRGMQRSSYGANALARVSAENMRAQQKINEAQTGAEAQIDQQRTQLQQQLQEKLSGYAADQAKDVLARTQELESEDYNRSVAAAERQTNIANQLYQNLYQQQRDTATDAQWQRQLNENIRQFNIQNHGKVKNTTEGIAQAGMIQGTGTNTAENTYYGLQNGQYASGKTKIKKKSSGSSSSSGSGSGGSNNGNGGNNSGNGGNNSGDAPSKIHEAANAIASSVSHASGSSSSSSSSSPDKLRVSGATKK